MKDFDGKVAVITGGAGDIGKALGVRFGQAGMKVVLADNDGERARRRGRRAARPRPST